MDLRDKVVVITGSSSGIGKELAFEFRRKGCFLVLAARNERALEEIKKQLDPSGERVLVCPTDVSVRSQMENLVKRVEEEFGRLDIFINNAGVSLAQGDLTQNREEDVRQTMETNFMAGIYSVWAAAPLIEKSGGGQFVFVSSIIGKRGIPRNAVYCASKFAVQGLTEAIRLELAKKNIRVITVCPPGVDTPFFANNQKGEVRRYHLYPARTIAALIRKACEKEKREVLLTWNAKLLYWLNVFFPKTLDRAIAVVKKA